MKVVLLTRLYVYSTSAVLAVYSKRGDVFDLEYMTLSFSGAQFVT